MNFLGRVVKPRVYLLFLYLVSAAWCLSGCTSSTGGEPTGPNLNDNATPSNANANSGAASNDNIDSGPPINENVGAPSGNANANSPVNANDNAFLAEDQTPGACCLANGGCIMQTRNACDGAFAGPGVECCADSCEVSPFLDEAIQRGIVYRALFPRPGPDIVPGSGIGFIDLDGDGDSDMMVIGRVGDGMIGVFENDGRGNFTDRSADTGIVGDIQARALCAGDYDADGDFDVYISCWEAPNLLLRNEGAFRFRDVTAEAGVANTGFGAGCSWGDYDGDGWLDLYTTDYGIDQPNRLFRNRGDGTFVELASALGVASGRRSMQGAFLDYDTDGDMDLYVANDLMGFVCPSCCNELYRNDGGFFVHVPDDTGANACLNSMCIAVGDVDNNQRLDLFFTDDSLPPGNILILGQDDGTFVNASTEAGVNPMGNIGWGATFFDYDNDGYEELFVTYNVSSNEFYENNGSFPLLNEAYRLGLDDPGQSYCTALADVDGDGDLDLALWNRQENIKLYINQEGHKRRWVKFIVLGEGRNLHAIGATVTIQAGGLGQIRHLMGGNNFKGHDANELHFGLNTVRTIDEIRVLWPGGAARTLHDYPANQTWKLYPPGRMGDANGDGVIGSDDRAWLEQCRGVVRPGCEMMDLNGDGNINDADANAL